MLSKDSAPPRKGVQLDQLISHLPAEVAHVFTVLRDLNLLNHLTQRSAIPSAVLPDNTNLLRPFRLQNTNDQETLL